MKKQILFVLALLCLHQTKAQPVCTNIEDFNPGEKFIRNRVDPATVNAGPTGANAIWNYLTAVLSATADTTEIIAASNSPYASLYPMASYVQVNSDGSASVMQKLADRDQLLAFVVDTSLQIDYDHPFATIRRPFTYGDTLPDTMHRDYEVAGFSYAGSGYSFSIADSWGTLMLPGITYPNVLRVKNIQVNSDTADGSCIITKSVTTSYNWYDANHVAALFSIDSILISNPFFADTTVNVSMLKTEIGTGISSESMNPVLRAYYADGSIYLTGMFRAGDDVSVRIFNVCGTSAGKITEHITTDKNEIKLPIPDVAPCQVYLARIALVRRGSAQEYSLRFMSRAF